MGCACNPTLIKKTKVNRQRKFILYSFFVAVLNRMQVDYRILIFQHKSHKRIILKKIAPVCIFHYISKANAENNQIESGY